jgi:uncharacterized phage protein gp47/JayE
MTPTIWLGGAVAACLALFVGGVTIKHRAQLAAAQETGIAIGTGRAATAALEAATEVAKAERAAEEAIPLTAERKELIRICNRSASCEERGKYKP